MNRILLIPNPNLCDLDKAVKDVTSYFEDFEVFIDPLETDIAYKCLDEKMKDFDVVVTLGGDGSMLKVVELVYKHNLCMFGINYGGLGYLTSLKKNELDVLRNKTYIEERSVLEVSIPTLNYKRIALNDAVIFKTNINVPIKLSVDDGSDTCIVPISSYCQGDTGDLYCIDRDSVPFPEFDALGYELNPRSMFL